MPESIGLYRATLDNGMEVAYIDKGAKNPLGMPRAMYEEKGYLPKYDELPTK